jgi:topoisomerase-4 subunit A
VVTEIPYQVQKSKLIEKLAELIQTKKVPILADVRDESADDIRIVLEPRSKNVDPAVLMGTLFRNSDLETRFSLNMNVLIDGRTPKVCSLKEVLRAFLDHRRDVLIRRSRHRMAKIDHRLEVLEGFIIAFLNLDRVIDIIRYDEMPKAALMREDWSREFTRATSEADYVTPPPGMGELTEVQAEAILNMRLRSLRRLEELELLGERDALMEERAELDDLLSDEGLQWEKIASELREVRKTFGAKAENGARRTQFAEAGDVEEVPLEAMIDREPVTIVCSADGLDPRHEGPYRPVSGAEVPRRRYRALRVPCRDHRQAPARQRAGTGLHAFGGKPAGRARPGGACAPDGGPAQRGRDRRSLRAPPGTRRLMASSAGRRLCRDRGRDRGADPDRQAGAEREGRRHGPHRGTVAAEDDAVAVVGENRKLLVFPLDEVPEMARGKGVRLQKYKDGGLSDARTFRLSEGLSWLDPAGRTRTETDLAEWTAKRATAGRMAPRGFPRDNRFT